MFLQKCLSLTQTLVVPVRAVRLLSTSQRWHTNAEETYSYFRTQEDNPSNHTMSHAGRIYTVIFFWVTVGALVPVLGSSSLLSWPLARVGQSFEVWDSDNTNSWIPQIKKWPTKGLFRWRAVPRASMGVFALWPDVFRKYVFLFWSML